MFQQRERGVFYAPDKDNFVPVVSSAFANKVSQNEMINAKQDIFDTAISNYRQGYKTSTTVKQLYEKYNETPANFV